MQKRKLGKSGLEVSAMGLGCIPAAVQQRRREGKVTKLVAEGTPQA